MLITLREATLAELHAYQRGTELPPTPPQQRAGAIPWTYETITLRLSEQSAHSYMRARAHGHLIGHCGGVYRVIGVEFEATERPRDHQGGGAQCQGGGVE